MSAPVIETTRLRLRGPQASDEAAMLAFDASPRAAYVASGSPHAVRERLHRIAGAWALRGWSWWVLEDRATGDVAGCCGFGAPPEIDEPELGWHLYDGFEGRGLATEAVTAARAHGAAAWGFTAPASLIDTRNDRSRRLAQRVGAVVERTFDLDGHPRELWRHPEARA